MHHTCKKYILYKIYCILLLLWRVQGVFGGGVDFVDVKGSKDHDGMFPL